MSTALLHALHGLQLATLQVPPTCNACRHAGHACRRYGLIGPNGCGKSSLLKALGNREVPMPEHIDIYTLDREMPPSDITALQVCH